MILSKIVKIIESKIGLWGVLCYQGTNLPRRRGNLSLRILPNGGDRDDLEVTMIALRIIMYDSVQLLWMSAQTNTVLTFTFTLPLHLLYLYIYFTFTFTLPLIYHRKSYKHITVRLIFNQTFFI